MPFVNRVRRPLSAGSDRGYLAALLSFVTEVETRRSSLEIAQPVPLPTSEVAVGIDVGLTTFAVISDGTEIANPRHCRAAERRLRIAQRKLSRESICMSPINAATSTTRRRTGLCSSMI